MIVTPETSRGHGFSGATAHVEWEEVDRDDASIYALIFSETAATDDVAAANWSALCTLHTAIRAGEARLRIVGTLDPFLRRGLAAAVQLFSSWYGDPPILIEAQDFATTTPSPSGATFQFFSGGVDSYATLMRNRRDFAPSAPLSVGTAVHVDWTGPRDVRLAQTPQPWQARELERAAPFLLEQGVQFVPAVTNARCLDDYEFYLDWMFRSHGAFLASIANLGPGLGSRALVASTYDILHLSPFGSHPLLDPLYSSTAVQIIHDSPDLSRLEKLRIVATSPRAVEALSVCSMWFERQDANVPNCGRCEKCLRTLAGLAAAGIPLGGLHNFEVAPRAWELETIAAFHDDYERRCWEELVAPLVAQGERELAAAIEALLARTSA